MPKVIFEDDETSVYLFTNIDEPNHSGKAMIRAALREYITRRPLDVVKNLSLHTGTNLTVTHIVLLHVLRNVSELILNI